MSQRLTHTQRLIALVALTLAAALMCTVLAACTYTTDPVTPKPDTPTEQVIAIDAATFPDDVYRNYVSATADTNQDGELSQAECDAVTDQDLAGTVVADLTGIEHFINLEFLDCRETNIAALPIQNNTKLKLVNCTLTNLTAIDLSANRLLESLMCDADVTVTGLEAAHLYAENLITQAHVADTDTFNPGATFQATYDTYGRLTTSVLDGVESTYTYDAQGRVTQAGTIDYTYSDTAIERTNTRTQPDDAGYFPYTYTSIELDKNHRITSEDFVCSDGMVNLGSVNTDTTRTTTYTYNEQGKLATFDAYAEIDMFGDSYASHATTEFTYPDASSTQSVQTMTFSNNPNISTITTDLYCEDTTVYITSSRNYATSVIDRMDFITYDKEGKLLATTIDAQNESGYQTVAYETNDDGYVTHAVWTTTAEYGLVNRDMSISYVKHVGSNAHSEMNQYVSSFVLASDEGFDRELHIWEPTNGGYHCISLVYVDPIEKAKLASGATKMFFRNGSIVSVH